MQAEGGRTVVEQLVEKKKKAPHGSTVIRTARESVNPLRRGQAKEAQCVATPTTLTVSEQGVAPDKRRGSLKHFA